MKIPHWPELLNSQNLRGAMQTLRGANIPRDVAAELAHIVTGTYDDAVVDNIQDAPTLRAAFDMADSYLSEDESDTWALAQLRMDVLAFEVTDNAFEYLNNRVKELEAQHAAYRAALLERDMYHINTYEARRISQLAYRNKRLHEQLAEMEQSLEAELWELDDLREKFQEVYE